ncbi:MAG TPA: HPP family protein [Geomonas sp.]|nr:HPP family protein [Geomonas sp.]
MQESATSKIIRATFRVGFLLCVPALVAWVSGRPFIFPSLGPSAFVLVLDDKGQVTGARVIGGHLIGLAGGIVAYHLLADGLGLTHFPSSRSLDLLRLAASGIVSVMLTTAGMLAAKLEHPPACATTLIVSLGLLSSWWDAVFIMVAVALMYGVHRVASPSMPG